MTLMLQNKVSKDPWMLPHSLFSPNSTPYILCIALKLHWVYKGSGIYENLLWRPLNDSSSLYDPEATEWGPADPLRSLHSVL